MQDAASHPSADSIVGGFLNTQGWVEIPSSTHLWSRAAQPGKTPVVANSIVTQVGNAQKITTTAAITNGQTVSGAIDLSTACLWMVATPVTLTATAVTFLANQDYSTYSALSSFARNASPPWEWNGDKERATLNPSVHHIIGDQTHFHGWLRAGVWESC
ncbi:hypothetical protein EDE12_11212 [Methylosinus sp. sav-2]|uniref:DUF6527 family protein n=1 Tax=Methylosinus sp. sav-2 TaxID=2485168 RepID=UPI000566B207|nr:DUF6527 family protein [Methylosinus sp. sav-2]TDX61911.1 hypothetical protein EDE12_11212 [Methylosinus sp. sav-2]